MLLCSLISSSEKYKQDCKCDYKGQKRSAVKNHILVLQFTVKAEIIKLSLKYVEKRSWSVTVWMAYIEYNYRSHKTKNYSFSGIYQIKCHLSYIGQTDGPLNLTFK